MTGSGSSDISRYSDVPVQLISPARPRWQGTLLAALLVYVVAVGASMLSGAGGAKTQHYVGLLADGPAYLAAVILAAATARRLPRGPLRTAWRCMAAALALYLVGTIIATVSWLFERDPFPGPADVFFLAFYPAFFAAVLFFVRARAMRVPWARLALDATILVVGFGAFFWFLVIRPAAGRAEVDVPEAGAQPGLRRAQLHPAARLRRAAAGRPRDAGSRRVPLLLLARLHDDVPGRHRLGAGEGRRRLPPGRPAGRDVRGVLHAARRRRARTAAAVRDAGPSDGSRRSASLVHGLPYVAMLVAFLVLVYVARADVGGPVAAMTIVVFVLTLLVMVRQGAMLRDDARMRERRATEIVEARYASLIANASDVILIVDADGALRFASPAFERTFGLKPDEVVGRNLLDLWTRRRRRACCRHSSPRSRRRRRGAVGPVELRVERAADRFTLEIVGSNLTADPGGAGPGAEPARHQRAQGARRAAARAGVPRSADAARQPQPVPRSRRARARAGAPRPPPAWR